MTSVDLPLGVEIAINVELLFGAISMDFGSRGH